MKFYPQVVQDFTMCLKRHGIQLVCFDFDETITVNGKRFVSKIFRLLFDTLRENHIHMAITTFNMGYDIKSLLLKKGLHPPALRMIPIIRRASDMDLSFGKFWHILEAMKNYSLPFQSCSKVLLIDDVKNNVIWARRFGFCALEVQRKKGLSVDDLLRGLANCAFYFFPSSPFPSIPSVIGTEKMFQSKIRLGSLFFQSKDLVLLVGLTQLMLCHDEFGHPFLLGLLLDSSHQLTFPFLVVETRIQSFLEKQQQRKKDEEI